MENKQYIKHDKDVISTFKPRHPFAFKVVNILGKIFDNQGRFARLLNVDSMMAKACRKTGLNDFGPNSYYKGFEVIINSLNKDAKLTTLGQITMHIILLNSLIVRLRVQQWVKEHPEVLEERIRKPFFIAGLPRTGTTILSFLMDMDPENRSLLHWETENPAPPPQLATASEDTRINKCVRKLKLLEKVIPNFQAVHPMSATTPTECIRLFELDFKNPFFTMLANIPTYQDWLRDTDMESSYQFHKLILKILQSSIPVQTWSLKSPAHMFRLKTLLKTYPDARLIFTHRDIQKVIPSTCSLMACFRRGLSDHVNLNEIGLKVVSRFKDGFKRLMEVETEYVDNNFYHLQYSEFIKDPIEAVHKIYRHFGKEVSQLHAKRMRAWLKFNPQNKHGRHKYSLTDFGLNPDKVEEEFGEYRTHYNIPYSDNL